MADPARLPSLMREIVRLEYIDALVVIDPYTREHFPGADIEMAEAARIAACCVIALFTRDPMLAARKLDEGGKRAC